MYGIDREREVARLSRRQMLRRGSMGALGLGLVAGQTRLAEACWGHGCGLFGRLHHRRSEYYPPATVPAPVPPAPAPAPADAICPRNWVGTGMTGGVQVFYYYALDVYTSTCQQVPGTPTYGMTFPTRIDPCCPGSPNCVGSWLKGGYPLYPASATVAGAGQNDLECGPSSARCLHYHWHDDTKNLEQNGIGTLGADLPTFSPQSGVSSPRPLNFTIPGKHGPIAVSCTQFSYNDGGVTRTVGVGLEFKADSGSMPTNPGDFDLNKCGPLKGYGKYHYFVEYRGVYYHVLTSKDVK